MTILWNRQQMGSLDPSAYVTSVAKNAGVTAPQKTTQKQLHPPTKGPELKCCCYWPIGVSKNRATPKSSILIRFSIIFTIHFGGFPPIFGNTHMVNLNKWSSIKKVAHQTKKSNPQNPFCSVEFIWINWITTFRRKTTYLEIQWVYHT